MSRCGLPLHRRAGDLVWSGTFYFLLIGCGFMLIEIGLLQRLSVFLGHPVYSLSVVLFSMILFTGIGSMISEYLELKKPAALIALGDC